MMKVAFLCLLAIGQLVGGISAFAEADQNKRSPQGLSIFAQTRSQFEVGIASVWGELQAQKSTAVSIPQRIANVPAGKAIAFEVCSAAPAWVRPESKTQMQQIKSTGRYADAKNNREIENLIQQFWTRNVILFGSYGLSARIEPIYLSGLWTIPNTIDSISNKCYASRQRILDLNSGKTAEIWLLLHKVKSIKWLENRYVMVVQPVNQGVQFIQFARVEQHPTPTLQVIAEDGRELEVINWATNPKN
jgi:hypothetical protein